MDIFEKALVKVYRKNPCQVLPNALWKTLAIADKYNTEVKIIDKTIKKIMLLNDKKLQVYWTDNRTMDISPKYINSVSFMLLHNDYIHKISLKKFLYQRYVRLLCQTALPLVDIPYEIVPVNTESNKELHMVSDIIDTCYTDLSPGIETVRKWTIHPVFDPSLWLWVLDGSTPVGLGIAEIDATVLEASLEWIQVLPEYRGQSIGKALVRKLLHKVDKKVKFTTVSGRENAKEFYKRCGFTGDDIWWVLTR